jgi:hypothetical protein
MSAITYKELDYHVGHKVELVKYGKEKEICLECEDCNEVLKSYTPEQDKETRVYLTNCSQDSKGFNFRDCEYKAEYDKIKDEAEKQGTVYSLEGFQEACNNEEIDLTNSFILID